MDMPQSSSCDGDQFNDTSPEHSPSFLPTDISEASSSSESPPEPQKQVVALHAYWKKSLTFNDQSDTILKCLLGHSYALTSTIIKRQLIFQDEDPNETLITAIRRATSTLSKGDTFCFLYSGLITDKVAPVTTNLIEPKPALETWLDKMIQTGTWPEDTMRLLMARETHYTTQRLGTARPSQHEHAGQDRHVFLYGTNRLGESSIQIHYNTVHQTCFKHAEFEVFSNVGL